MEIILASKSERRRELIKKISEDITIVPAAIDEKGIKEDDPVKFAVRAAAMKAQDVGSRNPSAVVIGADTVVALKNTIIGKPQNYEDAKETLLNLSGTQHRVITGIAIYKDDEKKLITGFQITTVLFKKLSLEDITEYLALGEYMDKAGSYAIQNTEDRFVAEIKGSYNNVVGLPVKKLRKLLDRFLAPEITADIYDIAFPKNWGVAKKDNLVVFVPDALPGDTVKFKIMGEKKNFSYGKISEIINPSKDRQKAKCPHFGICGGCAFQNLEYSKQIELKESYLLKTLEKLGKIKTSNIKKNSIIPSPDIFFYRNKMEFAFGTSNDKRVLGLRERGSPLKTQQQSIVSLQECPIFSKKVQDIFPVVIDFATKTGLDAYNPYNRQGFFRHLVLREGKNTGQIMAMLVTKSTETPNMINLLEQFSHNVEGLQSLWWIKNDRISDVVTFEKQNLLYGTEYIEEAIEGIKFRIHPSSFFQPNTRGAGLLYNRIKEAIKELEAKKVLGLYCGSGAIELSIASSADMVAGIDSEYSNIKNAGENCKENNIQNCRFYHGTVEKVLSQKSFEDLDIVIIDPPRAGLSGKALKEILKLSAPNIIYVSCNPATLARDLKDLTENGYSVKQIFAYDLFPHTTHLESMCILGKK